MPRTKRSGLRAVAPVPIVVVAGLSVLPVCASASGASTTAAHGGVSVLSQRTCGSVVLPGYARTGVPQIAHDPVTWVTDIGFTPAQQAAKASALGREGFIAGVFQVLRPTSGNDPSGEAVCYGEQFKTKQGAANEVMYQKRQEQTNVRRGGTFTPFAVAVIPGAFGFDSSESGFAGHNVEFVVGRDVVLVGVGYPLAASPAPTRQLVTQAAMTIYGRLVNHG